MFAQCHEDNEFSLSSVHIVIIGWYSDWFSFTKGLSYKNVQLVN